MTRRSVDERYFVVSADDCHLRGARSVNADIAFFPIMRRCPVTGGPVEEVRLASEGVLYSWTYIDDAGPMWAGRSGYSVGQIDLPEGARIQAPLVGARDRWRIGIKMRLIPIVVGHDPDGNELCSFGFEAIDGSGPD